MKTPLDRMNLRPAERRLVVAVGLMLFFMLNVWLVFPHFSDLQKVQNRIAKARKTQGLFLTEINQTGFYQARMKELESENLFVPVEEQNTHFANTRERVASESGVRIGSSSRVTPSTNQFFIELTQTINLQSKEQELVDFLYNLGSGNALIRVRDLSLRPDPSQQQLSAAVKLAASYQKNRLPRTATPAPPMQVAGAPAPAEVANSALPSATASATPSATNSAPATVTNSPAAGILPRRSTSVRTLPPAKAATQAAPKPTPKKS